MPLMRSAVLAALVLVGSAGACYAITEADIRRIVAAEIDAALTAATRDAGAAVAVRANGQTFFFNFGWADRARKAPVTPDSLFNLGSVSKVFDTTLLSLAVMRGEVALDDPVAKYIPKLRGAGGISAVTLGQLATFTSGFTLPQDHPPWPPAHYTWRKFVRELKAWKRDPSFEPGKHYVYSHAGFLLLHVALERRFGTSYSALLNERLLRRLGLSATALPRRGKNSVALPQSMPQGRAVQGYAGDGKPIGRPGNVQGYYHWPGTAQMFSSARDLAKFLTLQLGELPSDPALRDAIALSHRGVATIRDGVLQAQAWEVHHGAETVIGKNGGLNNASSFIELAPAKGNGVVVLMNRGDLNLWDAGYAILHRLSETEARRP